MGDSTLSNTATLAACSYRLVRRLLTIGENRLNLLAVEMQEEGVRLVGMLALTFAVAVFGLMAGMTLTAAIVVLLWDYSPAIVLLILTTLYATASACLARRLNRFLRDWKILAGTLEQLRKDRACLEKSPV